MDSNGATLARATHLYLSGRRPPETVSANARLIAAAPDLLAERDQLRARVAELEALIIRAAHVLCEQMPLPKVEYVAHDHNAAVLAIRKKAAALGGA